MLATLIIGLREGLEAALLVGVIAAFLRRRGRPLTAMWVGVGAAVLTSVGLAIGLWLLESQLPQAAQEGLEAVIGLIAVVFVTSMLLWTTANARSMRVEVEQHAERALRGGTTFALAGMAYLAVVKEGVESGIFLLATFRATSEPGLAAAGAVVGITVAGAVGVGLFIGAVRVDLRRFYRWSAPVLVLLAGGLVLTSARKAHEAGWIVSGQQQVADLSWLAPRGSVQGALVTGTLGLPSDPRLVEVVAWAAYVIPVLALVYWPAAWRPAGAPARQAIAGATVLVTTAAVAATLVAPQPAVEAPSVGSALKDTAAVVRNGVAAVTIRLRGGQSGDACVLDAARARAGAVTFTVINETSTAINELELLAGERILGEKENLAPGLGATSFTATLPGGRYTVYCPGATRQTQAFTVSGKLSGGPASDTRALLTAGTASYRQYAATNIAAMLTQAQRLQSRVDAGDVAGARTQYATARRFYERIESDVAGFVQPGRSATDNTANLDYLIDMRATNLDPSAGWHGFHALERDLWQRGTIGSDTRATASELVRNVRTLAGLAATLPFRPEDLANGAAGLMDEVQSSKIRGTEEAYSHLDLVDFAANVEGAQQAFADLQPGLFAIDPTLAKQIQARFTAVRTLLDHYRSASDAGGYQPYTDALRTSDGRLLADAVRSLQEPLAGVAAKVATA